MYRGGVGWGPGGPSQGLTRDFHYGPPFTGKDRRVGRRNGREDLERPEKIGVTEDIDSTHPVLRGVGFGDIDLSS